MLLAISAGWFLSIGVRFFYPALVPFFRAEFGLDLATTGLLLTALFAAYAIGHVPGGVLGDRLGEGNTLVLSTVVAAVTVLVVGTATTAWLLFAGTVAFALATALYGPTRLTVFTDIYPKRAGSAIGLTMAAGSVGNSVLPVVATVVATTVSWRASFLGFVPLFLAAALVLRVTVPTRTSSGSSAVDTLSTDSLRRIGRGVATGSIPIVVAIQICLSFVLQGFVSFYPTYVVTTKELDPRLAATLFGAYFAVGALVQPVTGVASDRFGVRRTLVVALVVTVVALWLLPFVHGLPGLLGFTLLLGSLSGTVVITQTYIADALPADVQGTGLGSLKAGWMLIGATAPLLVGVLADAGRFDAGFLLLAGVGSLGLALAVTRL